ncbi:MAG: DUF445 family protein [Desulfobacterales bacterium]|nr:DUF445 family protein [Desulfobacterales bacterium]
MNNQENYSREDIIFSNQFLTGSNIMVEAIMAFFQSPDIYKFLAIPMISGIVGWGTNVIALKMTFYPLEPFGKPPFFGWQGIVPAKVQKMASMSVDLMTSKLITVQEVFSQLDPNRVAKEMEPALHTILEPVIQETIMEYKPILWETLPKFAKDEIFRRSKRDLPKVIANIMHDVTTRIEEIFDLKHMVISALIRDKALVNELFLRCGKKEFKFIEHSGFYFGGLFGLVQMVLWYFVQPWWLLPVGGLIVGYYTNWLAIKMIFNPIKPKKYVGITFQGLFLKRQKEVAAEYSALVASQILNPANILDAIMRGPSSDEVFRILQKYVKQAVEKNAGVAKPFVLFVIGTQEYINMKNRVCDRLMGELPRSMKYVYDYAQQAWNVENILRQKMQELSPEEFVGILRPAFQEDEWILILVGGILGFLAGVFQLIFMFGQTYWN